MKGISYKKMTPAERAKLEGIEESADVNVKSDWGATSGPAQILNKPQIMTPAERAKLAGIEDSADANVKSDWNAASGPAQILNKPQIMTPAERAKLAGIEDGADVNVKSDWNATTGAAEILNKPQVMTSAERAKLAGIEDGADVNVKSDWNAASGPAQILNKPLIRPEYLTNLPLILGNNKWAQDLGLSQFSHYSATNGSLCWCGQKVTGVVRVYLPFFIPVSQHLTYTFKGVFRQLNKSNNSNGVLYAGVESYDKNKNEIRTDQARSMNWSLARGVSFNSYEIKTLTTTMSGYNGQTESDPNKFDPHAAFFKPVLSFNYSGNSSDEFLIEAYVITAE